MGTRMLGVFVLVLALVLGMGVAQAARFQVNGVDVTTTGDWTQLRSILSGLAGGETVRVAGSVARTAGDAAGGLTISAASVKLSGGWDDSFTTQSWASQTKLSNEVGLYSVLDVNGTSSGSNQYRVLTVAGTATGITVEGFTVREGYVVGANGGGISVDGSNATLSHLQVTENRSNKDYDGAGGIYVNATGARLEYLTVTNNVTARVNSWASGYGGAISVSTAALNGNFMLANSVVADNTAPDGSYGSAIELQGPSNPTAVQHWTIFGTVVADNPSATSGVIDMLGRNNGRANLVNSTVVDNGSGILVSQRGGTGNWQRDNYIINSILADTVRTNAADSNSQLRFQNSLIDPETPAAGSSYFDGTRYLTLGGNVTASQPLFISQAGNDFRLQQTSAANGTGLVRYSASGLGFAYVDVDRNSAYNSGIDVIVGIIQGGGQYVPGASEYYYPTDVNGQQRVTWVGTTPYLNMGALGTVQPPVAEANGPYTVPYLGSTALSGVGSTGVAPLSYAWNLDTDGLYDDAAGISPTVTYAQLIGLGRTPGTFSIGLEVTDGIGQTGTDTALLTLYGQPPTAEAGGSYTCFYGSTVALDGSGSTGNGPLAYAWDLDGSDFSTIEGIGVAPSFSWDYLIDLLGSGLHTVYLRVTDFQGQSNYDTAQLRVSPVAEPGSAGLVALGLVGLLRRRRRA